MQRRWFWLRMFSLAIMFILRGHPGRGFQSWQMKMGNIVHSAVNHKPGQLLLSLKFFMTCKSCLWLLGKICYVLVFKRYKWTVCSYCSENVLHSHLNNYMVWFFPKVLSICISHSRKRYFRVLLSTSENQAISMNRYIHLLQKSL